MTRRQVLCLPWLAGLCMLVSVAAALASPPEWLLNAAKNAAPQLPSDVPAVVLLDESVHTIQADGDEMIRHRCAIRILNRSGQQYAKGTVYFLDKDDRVSTSDAWVVRNGKEVSPKDRPQWINMSDADSGQIYSEVRKREVNYEDFALTNDVFGFETVVKGSLSFPRVRNTWEAMLPTIRESFTLQLPPGWTIQPVIDGPQASMLRTATGPQRWTWELLDRPYRPDEPAMTEDGRTDVRLMITIHPAADASHDIFPAFENWSDVSSWLMSMQDAQCDINPAMTAATNQLTEGKTDALGKIRALSRYVQNLRYVSYDKGLSKGFGVRPSKASEVFAKGWGDCKAKANLLRAMLRIVGIDSYMVQAHASLGRKVTDAWPAPSQFNHAILAIKVDDSVDLPAVIKTAKWGRLLFFDATNSHVLIGDLPAYLQGGKVQVLAHESDSLTTLPVLPAETHQLNNRNVQLELTASGGVSGICSYGGPGSVGAYYRASIKRHSAKDFRKHLTEVINTTVNGAAISDLTTSDDPLTGDCGIKYGFSAPHFAQLMPGGLAVVRLDVLSRDSVPAFPAKERKLPIALDPIIQRDEVTLKLPPGYVVDEMPERAELRSAYGHYESSYESANGQVVARRTLKLEDCTVPVSEYAALRKFLGDVAKADHASIVLRQGE